MRLAVEAADFGILVRDFVRNEIWASDKWRSHYSAFQGRNGWNSTMLSSESTRMIAMRSAQCWRKQVRVTAVYDAEYRAVLPSGEVRWIGARGRVEFDGAGKPILARGVSRRHYGSKRN